MLSPYRVLDLTAERALLCGQMLADLGADVVHVEPPAGASARRLGPFAGDVPHPDRSLFWWAQTRNQRSITLDLETTGGRDLLRRLAAGAHFVIESDEPGAMAARGLGADDLLALNPALVHVSVTPFGDDGPKARWAASDLVLLAAGGPLFLTGDDDRPPVRLPVPQAWFHAGAEAAVGALIAHHERQRSGRGQHVDVSAQEAVTLATQSYILCAAVGAPQVRRMAGGIKHGSLNARFVYPARDGFVAITFLFGSAIGPFARRIMEYVHDEGFCDAATRDKDWLAYGELLLRGREPLAEFERVKACIEACTRSKTKAELLEAALERGLLIAPVSTLDEVGASPQLAARGYWQAVEHPELGRSVTYPGPFARFGAAGIRYRRRPPMVGEHNREIYGAELGLDVADLVRRGIV
jgi:crotonobetainyl-CoA:carnitine CoA-transferase CaiB-like acyl-CoA transferase